MDDADRHWSGRRVLVTGCTGFLGGWVVRELLARGAGVVGLVRDRAAAGRFARHGLAGRVYPVHGRIEDTFRVHSALAVHEVSAVFHLAADPTGRGTETVLESVRRYDPRVPVVTARPAASATTLPHVPVPLGVATFGAVFGEGDRHDSRPVPRAIRDLLNGVRVTPEVGEPRDYVYAGDAARACVRLAEVLLGGSEVPPITAEFRSGWAMTPGELAVAVRAVFDGRLDDMPRFLPVANPIGWEPAASLADALAETIRWYRDARMTDSTRRAA
jgi:CDP-glucose 4,6-dehydratase